VRTHVRPTELGWKGLVLLGALVGAFLATAYSNTFFLMLMFCGALGVLACAWTATNVRGLDVVRVDVPFAAAGDRRVVHVQLRARRERRDIAIALRVGKDLVPVGAMAVVDGVTELRGELPSRARGVESVHAVRVTSRFPLGLFAAHVDLPWTAEIVTPPAPAAGAAAAAEAAAAGDHLATRGTRSASVQELRPFRSGDALGDVHWKATARRGTPVVVERERLIEHGLALVIDRRCAPEQLEHALAVAAAHEVAARERGTLLRVASQGASFAIARDRTATQRLQRWLADARVAPDDAGDPPRLHGAVRLGRAEARA
jgi:uncharacterized protein (DUF58 family)